MKESHPSSSAWPARPCLPFQPHISLFPLLNIPQWTGSIHHDALAPVPLLMLSLCRTLLPILFSDEQIQSPFWCHSSRQTSLISISPPPPLPSLFSSTSRACVCSHTIPHNHFTCRYLPFLVAPWRQGTCLTHLCLPGPQPKACHLRSSQ